MEIEMEGCGLAGLSRTTPACLTSVAVTAAATAAAAAGRTLFAGSRFVNRQRAALEIFLVEHGNSLGRVFLGRHFNEREAPGATRRSILHDVDCDHRARLGKVILQVIFGCGER